LSAPLTFEGGRRLHLRQRSALLIAVATWIARNVARSVDFAKVTSCSFADIGAKRGIAFPNWATRRSAL